MTMKSDARKKLHKILDLVLDINESGKATMFFRFSGHVNTCGCDIHIPEWEPDALPTINFDVNLENPEEISYGYTTLDAVIENLEKVMKG